MVRTFFLGLAFMVSNLCAMQPGQLTWNDAAQLKPEAIASMSYMGEDQLNALKRTHQGKKIELVCAQCVSCNETDSCSTALLSGASCGFGFAFPGFAFPWVAASKLLVDNHGADVKAMAVGGGVVLGGLMTLLCLKAQSEHRHLATGVASVDALLASQESKKDR